MTNEVVKAMNKNRHQRLFKEWWIKNSRQVLQITFFPLWGIDVLLTKIEKSLNNQQKWNEERADSILNYYVPRCAKWDNEEKCFYLYDNGMGLNIHFAKKFLRRKDRRFWKVNWKSIKNYLVYNFELEGFKKIAYTGNPDAVDLLFKMKDGEGEG